MKKTFLIACLALASAMILHPATGYCQNPKAEVSTIGNVLDTAFGNATKTQSISVGTADGFTVQYYCHHITDTTTGYASVWGSVDGTTYAQWPGADSVAITATADVAKLWFLQAATTVNANPVKYVQIRTRFVSNTTNATSKSKVSTKLFPWR